jgi:glycosyltransferase involved in cell wall biosynthesis
MPKFSIVIPTRSRPDTLAWTLRTALDQTYTDLEIIVHESGTDPRTEAVLAKTEDPRVRYIGTPNHLYMSENWERALSHATGEYVMLLGDDDGLLPSACAEVAGILAAHPAEAITWTVPSYYWPEAPAIPLRNRLQALVTDTGVVEVKSSRATLDMVYQFRAWYSKTPMIYTSFVSNSLIERVRSAHGRYFANEAPDIASGVVNLLFSDEFLCCMRPLSLSGQSHHSTGYQYVFGDPDLRASVETNIIQHLTIDSTMVRSPNFPLSIANYLLGIKQKLFRDRGPAVNYRNMLVEALKWNADAPPGCDSTLPDILEVARKNGISLADLPVPSVTAQSPHPATGVTGYPGSLHCDMDCASIGIHNVSGAARLMEALLPFRDEKKTFVSTVLIGSVNLEQQPAVELSFSKTGNGIGCLDFGWGEPEPWGVWTLGNAAEITIRIDGNVRSVAIRIAGSMFVHAIPPAPAEFPALAISCDGVRYPVEATFENREVDAEVRVALKGEGSTILLRFELSQPKSPLELGISNDSRRLGLGLRSVVLTRLPV